MTWRRRRYAAGLLRLAPIEVMWSGISAILYCVAQGQPDTAAETAELCRKASGGWGGKAIHIHTDVADREAVKAMVEEAAAQMGRIDVRSSDRLHSLTRCLCAAGISNRHVRA
jgi:hypothetical protein